ncbi:MAG: hypothetical protein GAK29_03199 [Acinetobacter bereziniae]|uniref:Uncharacterized protein n=1 Tax=Acinetobacter bereziniae TaxID=106648 RepID=A0A833PED6_ACIBZ|nr:MAG: hypothetical protein GAK29_03199 [Acinetobacter bereziniae]
MAKTIRINFPLVNGLIKTGNKVFLQASLRVEVFRERLPSVRVLQLPLEPVIAKWDTWLETVYYYAEYFESFIDLF